MPIASITKLMTALVVLEGKQPLDETLTILQVDRDKTKASASPPGGGHQAHSQRTAPSGSDVVGEPCGADGVPCLYRWRPGLPQGHECQGCELGMKNARFLDPTGLSSGNVATVSDLVKLVIAASHEPLIQEYSTSGQADREGGRQLLQFRNTNSLTSKEDWDISLQKTGFTQDAGQCRGHADQHSATSYRHRAVQLVRQAHRGWSMPVGSVNGSKVAPVRRWLAPVNSHAALRLHGAGAPWRCLTT